jgi:hypothetical protein
MTRLVVHIDRLTLRGLPIATAAAIGDALREQLGAELLAQGGLQGLGTLPAASSPALRQATAVHFGNATPAARVGQATVRSVAAAIHAASGRGGGR